MFTIPKAILFYSPAWKEGAVVILEGYQRAAIASLTASYKYHSGEGNVEAYKRAVKTYVGKHFNNMKRETYIKNGIRCKA